MEQDEKSGERRLDVAIKRAEKIYQFHENTASPAAAESSTTVYKLAKELLQFV